MILKKLKIPKNLESKWENNNNNNNKRRKERPNIKYKLVRLKKILSERVDWNEKLKLFHCSVYFCYFSWVLLHFLALFIGPIVLFQLTFTVLLVIIFQF